MLVSRRRFLTASAVVPFAARAGAGWAADNDSIDVPIRFIGSRVAIALRLGRKGPFDFMIDTGAFGSLIKEDIARSLNLPPVGQIRFNGRLLTLYSARDVVFADVFRQSQITFGGLVGGGLGDGIAGTLAAGVVTDIDGDLDFARGRWRLYPKGRQAAPAGFSRLDSEIAKGGSGIGSAYIFVKGGLGGKRYRFLVDTGAPGSISLFHSAARDSGFAEADLPYAPVHTASTNGPGKVSRLVRGDVLDLGNGIRFDKPFVMLNQNSTWNFPGADGIIGLSLLRQLNLATDTRTRSIWAKPNGVTAPRDRYPRSGLWIDRAKHGVIVSVVGTGSPAAMAGIRPGDVLPDMDFETALTRLGQSAGTTVNLIVERDGVRRQVSLTLADYL